MAAIDDLKSAFKVDMFDDTAKARVVDILQGALRAEKVIHLKEANIRDVARVHALLEGLQGTAAQELNLEDNHINTVAAINALMQGISGTKLRSLNLKRNALAIENSPQPLTALEAIVAGLIGKNVVHLGLALNGIDSVDKVQRITGRIKETNLRSLDLSWNNGLNNIDVINVLTAGLQGSKIQKLNLSHCCLENKDVLAALANGLKTTNVHTLVFQSNIINPKNLEDLLTNLVGSKVATLDLKYNMITKPEHIAALSRGLKNSPVATLDLRENFIKDDCVEAIIQMIQDNPQLTTLHLNPKNISADNMQSIYLAISETPLQASAKLKIIDTIMQGDIADERVQAFATAALAEDEYAGLPESLRSAVMKTAEFLGIEEQLKRKATQLQESYKASHPLAESIDVEQDASADVSPRLDETERTGPPQKRPHLTTEGERALHF